MNKEQFIQRLDELLRDISDTERLEAVAYYREYFEDAGEENEQQVIRELGSPEEVAHNIREELASKEITQQAGSTDTGGAWDWEPEKKEEKKRNPVIVGLLAVIAILLIVMAGIPVVSGIIGSVIGLVAVFFGILAAAWVVGIVFILTALVLFGVALVNLFAQPVAAMLLLSAAFLLFGAGVLLVLAGLKLCTVLVPAAFRRVAQWCAGLFYRRGRTV